MQSAERSARRAQEGSVLDFRQFPNRDDITRRPAREPVARPCPFFVALPARGTWANARLMIAAAPLLLPLPVMCCGARGQR